MGREARRAQQRAERRAKQQQSRQRGGGRAGPAMSAPATPAEQARRSSIFKPRWAMDIISELRKVTWPGRSDIAYLTMVVVIIALIVGAILGSFDLFFGWLIEQTILR